MLLRVNDRESIDAADTSNILTDFFMTEEGGDIGSGADSDSQLKCFVSFHVYDADKE